MNAFCYKFISGYGSAKFVKNQLRFARDIDKSLLPRFYAPQCRCDVVCSHLGDIYYDCDKNI